MLSFLVCVTSVMHFEARFSLCLPVTLGPDILNLIPVQPEHYHLMEQADGADHHRQQGALHWVWCQNKTDDFHEVRDGERDQEE